MFVYFGMTLWFDLPSHLKLQGPERVHLVNNILIIELLYHSFEMLPLY